jgi:gamma-glutamyl hydrolase
MTELNLNHDWRFMTTNEDSDGLEYISTLEHKQYPLYGLQFHPEKNIYEWREDKAHNHSADGIRVSQYFANFFVNEARKSQHKFGDESEERCQLIYNFPVTYTGDDTIFQQCYVFEI